MRQLLVNGILGADGLDLSCLGLADADTGLLQHALPLAVGLQLLDIRGNPAIGEAGKGIIGGALLDSGVRLQGLRCDEWEVLPWSAKGDSAGAARAAGKGAKGGGAARGGGAAKGGGGAGAAAAAVSPRAAAQAQDAARTLDAKRRGLQTCDIVMLAAVLKHSTALTACHLSGNCFQRVGSADITGVAALCKALATNATLRTLDLSSNCIGVSGAKALAGALAANGSITELDLADNGVCGLYGDESDVTYGRRYNGEGFAALTDALAGNTTMAVLHIERNDAHMTERERLKRACQNDRPAGSHKIQLPDIEEQIRHEDSHLELKNKQGGGEGGGEGGGKKPSRRAHLKKMKGKDELAGDIRAVRAEISSLKERVTDGAAQIVLNGRKQNTNT
jgi:hypothetical protein